MDGGSVARTTALDFPECHGSHQYHPSRSHPLLTSPFSSAWFGGDPFSDLRRRVPEELCSGSYETLFPFQVHTVRLSPPRDDQMLRFQISWLISPAHSDFWQ
jgi:hypothetical protein